MTHGPPLPPPAIEQPAPYEVSYGLVTGHAAPGTRRVVVSVNGRVLASRPLRGRRFTLHVALPTRDVSVRVTTIAGRRRSSAAVADVFGLPAAARPRIHASRNDPALARKLRRLARGYDGTCGLYVQSLTGGSGAAWNARARFPAASTLKLAIAAAVLAELWGRPSPGSGLDSLLRTMLIPSDDKAANTLLVWLGGSTSGGGHRVDSLLRLLGLRDTLMYGGYEIQARSSAIPIRADESPSFGAGKYTTAYDMAALWRAIWLASGGKGPLLVTRSHFTSADARYLLWIAAHVRDSPKLDSSFRRSAGVVVLHKAGWISSARHDTGLVFWQGGVFVASALTWRSSGVGTSSDRLAARLAERTLARLRRREG